MRLLEPLNHIDRVIEALKFSVISQRLSYWFYKPEKGDMDLKAKIDLLIERADNFINLCDIQFSNNKLSVKKDYADRMNQKRELFRDNAKTKKSLFNTLITPNGAHENPSYHSCLDQQLSMDSLFMF